MDILNKKYRKRKRKQYSEYKQTIAMNRIKSSQSTYCIRNNAGCGIEIATQDRLQKIWNEK